MGYFSSTSKIMPILILFIYYYYVLYNRIKMEKTVQKGLHLVTFAMIIIHNSVYCASENRIALEAT